MEFHFVDAEPLVRGERRGLPQPTSPCQRCGGMFLNEDMRIAEMDQGKMEVCDGCLIEADPARARTYYYDGPCCGRCGYKMWGNHACGARPKELGVSDGARF